MVPVELFPRIGQSIVRFHSDQAIGALKGFGSEALFFFYAAAVTADNQLADTGARWIEKCLDLLDDEKTTVDISYGSGVAGFSWTLRHLVRNDLIDFDLSSLDIFDPLFAGKITSASEKKDYDFTLGLIGFAYPYLLISSRTAQQDELLKDAVSQLCSMAVPCGNGLGWLETPNIEGEEGASIHNLGLAHGIPSIVTFLSKCYAQGILPEKIKTTVESAMNYLLSLRLDLQVQQTYRYPSRVINGKSQIFSRLGWCYGDPGLALMFWQAGKIFNREDWKNEALLIAENCTLRKDINDTRVVDANLCHGSAGMAAIFQRFYWETNDRRYRDAALYWTNTTLEYLTEQEGFPVFPFRFGEEVNLEVTGVLEGTAGVGLGLLSVLSEQPLAWDECMLLS